MGGASSTHVEGFWRGYLRESDHSEDLGVNGIIVLRWTFSKWDVGAWTELSQVRDRWSELINAVMNLNVP